MAYPSFLEHIRATHGTKWGVMPRLTDRARRQGYEMAIPQKRYNQIYANWAMGHPTYQLALTLPDCPERDTILTAIRRELGDFSAPYI